MVIDEETAQEDDKAVVDMFPARLSKLKPEGATKRVPLFEGNEEKEVVLGET